MLNVFALINSCLQVNLVTPNIDKNISSKCHYFTAKLSRCVIYELSRGTQLEYLFFSVNEVNIAPMKYYGAPKK